MSDDVDAPIKYSGVVYNEMKGVYSSADQTNAKAVRQARTLENTLKRQ